MVTAYFIDTSALAKYYVPESGTRWLRRLLRPSAKPIVIVADTTPVEMFSLLKRKQRAGAITLATMTSARNNFLNHIQNRYLVVFLNSDRLKESRDLVDRHDLRTLDAIQLACALHATNLLAESMTFLSSDHDLLLAAQAEGFSIDNPNSHP